MNKHDIVVIGASAGGVDALTKVVSALPVNIAASIFIVLHLAPEATSMLPQILMRHGSLSTLHPKSGDIIEQGKIYVAPNNRHLLIKDGQVLLSSGPRENGFRPSIDSLFRTAAKTYGSRVIGIVLTGMLDNGSAGLVAVKEHGGMAIVQDPKDALFPSMPEHALKVIKADYTLPLAQIPELLVRLSQEASGDMQKNDPFEHDSAEIGDINAIYTDSEGKISDLSCPECGGVLVEFRDGKDEQLVNFRCRVGHRYSLHSMLEYQAEAAEAALWAGVRALEESSSVSRRMEGYARDMKDSLTMERYTERAQEAEKHADIIRQILLGNSESSSFKT